jgi:CBS-domain-containing membrane protein
MIAPLYEFILKMKGRTRSPPSVGLEEVFWSWLGSFLGIAAVAYISFQYLETTDLTMIIGSFGASAVLIYAAITSPLAQPRNLMGGHVISAVIGVAVYQNTSDPWIASALAVSFAIAAMHATKTLHPPGGATALIAVIGSDKIHALGYTYTLIPVASGAAIMLVIALVTNNLAKKRSYPEYWF